MQNLIFALSGTGLFAIAVGGILLVTAHIDLRKEEISQEEHTARVKNGKNSTKVGAIFFIVALLLQVIQIAFL